jgi:hypothetical protein
VDKKRRKDIEVEREKGSVTLITMISSTWLERMNRRSCRERERCSYVRLMDLADEQCFRSRALRMNVTAYIKRKRKRKRKRRRETQDKCESMRGEEMRRS